MERSTSTIQTMLRGVSLATKCQLLFGAAIVLIIAAALLVPWLRTPIVVDASQLETSRQIARLWERTGSGQQRLGPLPISSEPLSTSESRDDEPRIEYVPSGALDAMAERSEFLEASLERFRRERRNPIREHAEALWDGSVRVYRYALADRDEQTGELQGVLVLERRSPQAASQFLINRVYIVVAGALGIGLASLVFYLITTRIILKPVRTLRDVADRVRAGDLTARSDIPTGDEFQELGDTFNAMLESLTDTADRLRSTNRSLDLRIGELARSNTALYESAKLKGDFLANVSHELRTPLNSIIGFAELLQSIAESEATKGQKSEEELAVIAKRNRYLDNIVNAGRTLLEMINELLEMAKIEAGKIDVNVERVNVVETCDGLLGLIRPLADRRGVSLTLETPPDTNALPIIRTDPRKFQQVVFNFLSNAVKFTPEGGRVTLRAERAQGANDAPRIRVSVLDTGPGIPEEHHEAIFEKFRQLDAGHTKSHGGTGLGLAIAKELATILQGEIQLVSAPGSGSMFSLIVPVDLDLAAAQEASRNVSSRIASMRPDESGALPALRDHAE
ncbi:MAG: ATP-binding protein [Phycisphaerales bacterium]